MPRPNEQPDWAEDRYDPDADAWSPHQPGGGAFGFQRGRGADYGSRPPAHSRYGRPPSSAAMAADPDWVRHDTGFYDRGYGRNWTYGPSMSWRQAPPDFARDDDRGFLERAGDEVASWFGDDEARRRREADYRGIGPKGYIRSDERVREDVCDRLSDHPYIDASDIEVSAKGGEVTLSGAISSRRAKRAAEDCADRVSGVTHVQNNLRVTPGQTAGETALPRSTPL